MSDPRKVRFLESRIDSRLKDLGRAANKIPQVKAALPKFHKICQEIADKRKAMERVKDEESLRMILEHQVNAAEWALSDEFEAQTGNQGLWEAKFQATLALIHKQDIAYQREERRGNFKAIQYAAAAVAGCKRCQEEFSIVEDNLEMESLGHGNYCKRCWTIGWFKKALKLAGVQKFEELFIRSQQLRVSKTFRETFKLCESKARYSDFLFDLNRSLPNARVVLYKATSSDVYSEAISNHITACLSEAEIENYSDSIQRVVGFKPIKEKVKAFSDLLTDRKQFAKVAELLGLTNLKFKNLLALNNVDGETFNSIVQIEQQTGMEKDTSI